MKPLIVLACLTAAALSLPAQAQTRTYKCIDGAGKVYYSDKLNPDCGQGTELNKQGVVMKKKEVAAKPGPTVKGDPPAELPKSAKEQERRDRALMATYTSEEEIDAARDRSLAIPAQGTKTNEAKLEKVNQHLTDLKKQADTLAAQQKPLPPHLLDDVAAAQKDIGVLETDLAQRKIQSDGIRAKYEAEKKRFRELKGVAEQASK
jgi:hypothetical protein